MRRRPRRLAASIALVATLATGSVLSTAAPAAAAPAFPTVEPIIVGDCATTVRGEPGQPLALNPSAVVQPVLDVVRAIPILGPPLVTPLQRELAKLPPVPIGAIPVGKPGEQSYITGGQIARIMVEQLRRIPLLGGVLAEVTNGVTSVLTGLCGVTVQVTNTVAAPIQQGTQELADGSQRVVEHVKEQLKPGSGAGPAPSPQPATPPEPQPARPGGSPSAEVPADAGLPMPDFQLDPVAGLDGNTSQLDRVPLPDYSDIPFALPGYWAPSPDLRYDTLSLDQYLRNPVTQDQAPESDEITVVGQARALPSVPNAAGLAAPVVLAALALSAVTAALVRTWVLRRSAA
ncbi:MAG TPA: hypothetical protein VIL00_04790 [Pseudonocardiaceae bacterium]